MNYVGGNLDTFTVTRIASAAVLGQYTRAYYLVYQPLGNYLAQALTNVLFSTLSRIQQDLARLRRAYLSVLSLGNLMLFPICAGIAVAAHEVVLVVLGPQWNLAVGLVPWFALAGGCNVASQLTQLLADARAELNRSLAVQTAYIAGLALLILLALPFRSRGVWVIGAAVAAAEVLRYVGYLALARRVLEMPWTWVWQAHVPAAWRWPSSPPGGRWPATPRPWWCSGPRPSPGCSRWRSASGSARCRLSAPSSGCA
jgi:O-antigen/teichoic acid export membrane protein